MSKPISGFRISQIFGINPQIYNQFGLAGHNGIDFATPTATPVYATQDLFLQSGNDGNTGYGLFLRGFTSESEEVFAHLSSIVKTGYVSKGERIAYTGNTGFSTGPHLHWGYRRRKGFMGPVQESGNGFAGYIDQSVLPIWEDNQDYMSYQLYRTPDGTVFEQHYGGIMTADALLIPFSTAEQVAEQYGSNWASKVIAAPAMQPDGIVPGVGVDVRSFLKATPPAGNNYPQIRELADQIKKLAQ